MYKGILNLTALLWLWRAAIWVSGTASGMLSAHKWMGLQSSRALSRWKWDNNRALLWLSECQNDHCISSYQSLTGESHLCDSSIFIFISWNSTLEKSETEASVDLLFFRSRMCIVAQWHCCFKSPATEYGSLTIWVGIHWIYSVFLILAILI